MNKQAIIHKTLVKLGMFGDPDDVVAEPTKQKLFKRKKKKKDPNKIYGILDKFIDQENLSKQAVQNLLAYFKQNGLFKRLLGLNIGGMEKMWRTIIKEQNLAGFLLES